MDSALKIVLVRTAEEWEQFCAPTGLGPLDAATVSRHEPDAQWVMLEKGRPCGRCSLWFRQTPPYGAHRLGFIGHYAARDRSVAGALLEHACSELSRNGCTLAIAPIDGNTWRRYRLLTERGSLPLFFLEPDNPDDWPAHFTGHGFSPLARYCSAVADDLRREDPRIEQAAGRLAAEGFTIRSLAPGCFLEEMRGIFHLALASFTRNFLYSPIREEEFTSQYAAIQPHVRPELVLIAEQQGEPAGFVFAVPDLLQTGRGVPLDTVVVKTLAVQPRFTGRGLGNVLIHRVHQAARQLGFRRAIHALMHEVNPSTRISARSAVVFRRYALYSRTLG